MPLTETLYQPFSLAPSVTAVPFARDARIPDEVFASARRLTVEEQDTLPAVAAGADAVVPAEAEELPFT